MVIEIRKIGYEIWELIVAKHERGDMVEHIGDFGNLLEIEKRAVKEANSRNLKVMVSIIRSRASRES